MRVLFWMITVGFLAVGNVPATAQQADIEGVINDQLSAIQADDFERAFTFASPTIKRLFGTPSRFGQMVRGGYPMVHRPRQYEFKELQETNGTYFQRVLIEDQAGRFFVASYAMIQTDAGWKIDGVSIEESPMLGA